MATLLTESIEPLLEFERNLRGRASESLRELKEGALSTPYGLPPHSPRYRRSPRETTPLYETSPPASGRSPRQSRTRYDQLAAQASSSAVPLDYHSAVESLRSMLKTKEKERPASPTKSQHKAATRSNEKDVEKLLEMINTQNQYVKQLEGENKFYREELGALKHRTEKVLEENDRIHEELKAVAVHQALEQSPFGQEGGTSKGVRQDQPPRLSPSTSPTDNKKSFAKWQKELERLKAFHAAKTNRLEAQLAYTREELSRYEKRCEDLRGKLRSMESLALLTEGEGQQPPLAGLCVRCAQEEAVVAGARAPTHLKTIERLTQERDELMESVTSLRAGVEEVEQRESDAYAQVKESVAMVEQAQLEKAQALVQKEQLEEEVKHYKQRIAKLIQENEERLDKERGLVRNESKKDVEVLNTKVTALLERCTTADGQIEKVKREKEDLFKELGEAKAQISQQNKELALATENMKLTSSTATVQRDEALRQLESLKHTSGLELKEREQVKVRLIAEVGELRRRLEVAERDSEKARADCVKLTESFNAAEQEALRAKLAKESLERNQQDGVKSVSRQAQMRQEELSQVIQEMEIKHSLTVGELEDMVASQSTLINKLREECKSLTQMLDSASTNSRMVVKDLKLKNESLSRKADRLQRQHTEMESQCVEHGRLHDKMKARLLQIDEHAQRSAQQILELLQKQNRLMNEKQVLSKEVEFLQLQLRITPKSSSKHIAINSSHGSDLDDDPNANIKQFVGDLGSSSDGVDA